jgi:SNF2 family DNA or RNA helicase
MFLTRDKGFIVVPWRADLQQVIPHARALDHNGEKLLIVPNQTDEAKVARNLGVEIPTPILTRYDWRGGKPWETQKTTAALLTESPRAYVLNEFGTGKTRSVIWATDFMRSQGRIKRVLIAAPLSTLTPVWENELFKVLPQAKVRVLHGEKRKRRILLAEDAEYYIINHHGLKLLQYELAKRRFDVFVLDELATFRNKTTDLWKSANLIIQSGVEYVWGLTGSPTPKAPTDAWAQVKLLTPDRTTKTFTRFRDITMQQVSQFRWIKRPGASEVIHEAMQPSVRFALSDVVELPETIYQTRQIPLEGEGKRAYELMYNKMRLMTNNGETVTAANEGVLQSKLMQVAMGYIYTDKKGVAHFENESRLEAVQEIVSATSRKVICFVPFLHAMEGVAAYLQRKHISIAVVNGSTPIGFRNKIFRAFQNDDDPKCLVAHPACMSHGLTLTAANTIVWVGPVNSYETYEQANARIVRPGQVSKTLIVHIVGTPVERLAYTRLRDRATFQGMLLDLFRQQKVAF